MLGLLGKGQAVLRSENAKGELLGGQRHFYLPGTPYGNTTAMIAEPDFSGDGFPVAFTPFGASVPQPGSGVFRQAISSMNSIAEIPKAGNYLPSRISRTGVQAAYTAITYAMRFSHNDPMTPATRDYRARIQNPADVVLLVFGSEGNAMSAFSVSDTQWQGDLKDQLAQFQHYRAIYMARQGVISIGAWPAALEMVHFKNCPFLQELSPFPTSVRHVSWGVGEGRAASFFNEAMQDLSNLEDLYFAIDSGYPQNVGYLSTGITGTIVLTGKNKLKVYTMVECPAASHVFPESLAAMEVFDHRNSGIDSSNIPAPLSEVKIMSVFSSRSSAVRVSISTPIPSSRVSTVAA